MAIPGSVRFLAAFAVLFLLAGCAERVTTIPDQVPAPPRAALPADPGALVLRVELVGGFLLPGALLSRTPQYSLYADGRLITNGPVPAIYPAPALPNVQVQQLDEAGVQELVDRALAAGIGETADLGSPPIADMPSTRFTVTTAEGRVVREVESFSEYAGEGDGAEAGLTEEQVAGRARLRELLTVLSDVGQEGFAGQQVETYVPSAVAAIATPWTDPEDDLAHPEQAWPGPELPGEAVVGPLDVGCVVATGEQASAVLAAAEAANAATPWVSGGARWSVAFRPLLPDESGCADLGG